MKGLSLVLPKDRRCLCLGHCGLGWDQVKAVPGLQAGGLDLKDTLCSQEQVGVLWGESWKPRNFVSQVQQMQGAKPTLRSQKALQGSAEQLPAGFPEPSSPGHSESRRRSRGQGGLRGEGCSMSTRIPHVGDSRHRDGCRRTGRGNKGLVKMWLCAVKGGEVEGTVALASLTSSVIVLMLSKRNVQFQCRGNFFEGVLGIESRTFTLSCISSPFLF